ncbi:membrane-bound lytic murein transglycosylase MltC [Candidatus Fukatsuia anoeciicola]|uniref:membrane-bound lytic murein transglycosylase MltC n=1 Tax=Candidatus Fukatsuia anoeciicola TaxID=2994492 RepID=UPI003463B45D
MKRILVLLIIIPLLLSCSCNKEQVNNKNYIKDTNSFDILIGQFAHNIENIWGLDEILIASSRDYVKYTDKYQTRSHINFYAGTITFETIAKTNPKTHLRQTIIATLLMGDDSSLINLYSDVDDIQISKEPFLYGQILDNNGKPIRWKWHASQFAEFLLQNRIQKRNKSLQVIWSITVQLVPNHLNKRAHKYLPLIHQAAIKYQIKESLILAIIQIESSFNPYATSNTNALGLMQIMQQTAGKDVFKMKGQNGYPSCSYLFNPKNNIDIGVAYLSILQENYLGKIHNNTSRYYIMVMSYNGGVSSVLRLFSKDKDQAFIMINNMKPGEVFNTLITKHPASQSRRYLIKVNNIQKNISLVLKDYSKIYYS